MGKRSTLYLFGSHDDNLFGLLLPADWVSENPLESKVLQYPVGLNAFHGAG